MSQKSLLLIFFNFFHSNHFSPNKTASSGLNCFKKKDRFEYFWNFRSNFVTIFSFLPFHRRKQPQVTKVCKFLIKNFAFLFSISQNKISSNLETSKQSSNQQNLSHTRYLVHISSLFAQNCVSSRFTLRFAESFIIYFER